MTHHCKLTIVTFPFNVYRLTLLRKISNRLLQLALVDLDFFPEIQRVFALLLYLGVQFGLSLEAGPQLFLAILFQTLLFLLNLFDLPSLLCHHFLQLLRFLLELLFHLPLKVDLLLLLQRKKFSLLFFERKGLLGFLLDASLDCLSDLVFEGVVLVLDLYLSGILHLLHKLLVILES